ncbi:hypothetical protein ACTFIZ_007559 [Dictyostelium cf. discoideum]
MVKTNETFIPKNKVLKPTKRTRPHLDTVWNYYRDLKNNKERGQHGGLIKKLMFNKEEYTLLIATIVEMVKEKPNLGLNEIAKSISSLEKSIFFGKVNKSRVKSIFDLLELTRKKAVGPIGKPVFVCNESSILETYNGFFMINMFGCKYKLRDETNTTEDFIKYLKDVLESGFILSGSILVMDNAPIHGGVEALEIKEEVLKKIFLDEIIDSIVLKNIQIYSLNFTDKALLFGMIKKTKNIKDLGKPESKHF